MSKNKNPQSKPVYKKKSLTLRVGIIIIVIAFAGYMIYNNIFTTDKPQTTKTKNMGHSIYDFTMEGDLSFMSSDEIFITRIEIEIADDEESRMTGLMYRSKMEEDQGMLFIFPEERQQSFWMRNTVLPLDIIFVNSKREIVTIHNNTKPFDENSYPSTAPAIYVVEVNAGYCAKHGIKVGDKINWRRN